MWRLTRKQMAPSPAVAADVGVHLSGALPDLAGIVVASVGQLVQGALPLGHSREQVVKDEAIRDHRAKACEDFGWAIAFAW